jgi:hypothetical protein
VFVTIENKPGSQRPLVPDRPKHAGPVLLVERIPCINEKKTTIFLLFMLVPHKLHRVDSTFDA